MFAHLNQFSVICKKMEG